VNPNPNYCDGRERKPLPESDLLISQISGVLAARSEGRIRFPVAVAETLEKLRDQAILRELALRAAQKGGHH